MYTWIHIFDVKVEDKTEIKLLKSNGVFLNLLKNHVDSKKFFSDWLETTAFSSDDILGTVTNTNLSDGIITVIIYLQHF